MTLMARLATAPIANCRAPLIAETLPFSFGNTESAATMTFYILVSFILVSSLIGLGVGDGRYAGHGHASLEFLLRAWAPVDMADMPILVMLGVSGVMGGFLISQAYRLSEAAFAAPFEYVSMPMAIMWGITVFGTFPDRSAWIGITLILGSGLYLVWRETRKGNIKKLERQT